MLDQKLMGKVKEVVEVDLLERPIGKSRAKCVGNGFSVGMGANSIASVKVALAK